MILLIKALSTINILLAIMTALPCLIAGAMSMDSPQAQHSTIAHLLCYMMLSFPLVCLVCGLFSLFIMNMSNRFALLVCVIPILEAIVFFGIIFNSTI
jgi:hypothetical protein